MEKVVNNSNRENTNVVYDPLVSIIVITYNSSKYVLETLESIKLQTYKNIELVIADDCSTDSTIGLCENWLENNRGFFKNTVFVPAGENSGIAPNCNRGISVANGKWVKLIAGDDVLLPSCITALVEFVTFNRNCKIVFGRIKFLKAKASFSDQLNPFFSLQQKEQFAKILTGSGIRAPASFIKHSLLREVGGFNEEYKMIEDTPLWFKISKIGTLFYFLNSHIVLYRLHEDNISMGKKNYINVRFYHEQKRLIENLIIPELRKLRKFGAIANLKNTILINDLIVALGNKNTYTSKFISLFIVRNTYNKAVKLVDKLRVGSGV